MKKYKDYIKEEISLFSKKPNKEIEELTEPVTLEELLQPGGGINRIDIYNFLNILKDRFYMKKIKTTSLDNSVNTFFVTNVTIEIDKRENYYNFAFKFYSSNGHMIVGKNTKIQTFINRKITKEDPFGEENWEK